MINYVITKQNISIKKQDTRVYRGLKQTVINHGRAADKLKTDIRWNTAERMH